MRQSTQLTVLLIDADVQVLTDCARIFEGAHYHVLMATGCSQAETLCGWYGGALDFILADLMLFASATSSLDPEPSHQLAGDRVFRLAHRKWPCIRIALMSAEITSPPELARDLFGGRFRYLQKPIEKHSLLGLVEAMLEGRHLDASIGVLPGYSSHGHPL